MTKQLKILILVLITGLLSCSRKSTYVCGLKPIDFGSPINCKVLKLERTAIADTTIAGISGTIFSQDIKSIDTLVFANVYALDKKTRKVFGDRTDIKGHYQFNLPASTYDLKIEFIGYNTLIIRDAIFGTGDVVKFNAIIGTGQDSSVFKMKTDRSVIEIYQPTK